MTVTRAASQHEPHTDRLSAGTRFLLAAACFVITVAGMKAAVSIVVPFLLAVFVAIICLPALLWLQRKRVPTVLAVLIIVIAILVSALLVGALVGTSLNEFSAALPEYQQRLREETAALRRWLGGLGIEVSETVVHDMFDPGIAMQLAANMLTGLTGVLTRGLLIVITVIFILLEASTLPAKLRTALRDPEASLGGFALFVRNLNRYLAIKTVISLITGVAVGVWVALLGVDYAVLWGLLAFLLNFVPNIGSIIAAVPAVLLAWLQSDVATAAATAVGYLVVNLVLGNLIEPRLMGRRLGLSPLIVFLSLLFWGWVLGPVGMLLSVPLTMILKIGLETNTDTRWVAVLLGSAPDARATRSDAAVAQ